MVGAEITKNYLDKYPNIANMTLAKKIYNENKLVFRNLEVVRTNIRRYRGKSGMKNLKEMKNTKYLDQEALQKKYNLPKSIETNYIPYSMIGKKGLIFGDVHIPFHNEYAILKMFEYTVNKEIDFILILGDLMDCFDISSFNKEPDVIRFNDERNMTKEFIKELKRIYPKATIYYKFGNHEKRFEDYLKNKAPEIYDCEEFRLEILLDLFNLGIKYIEEDRYVDIMGLSALHSHEYKNGITSPANSARTLFLRTKSTAIGAHNHQSSEHVESRIGGEIITCWSIGCLCNLHPKYMPLNKWNHGFAIYERFEDNFWNIQNKKIIEGRVV